MRALIRKRNDTSAIWGDLARVDYLDTDSRMRRGLSRFVFALALFVCIALLIGSGYFIATMREAQPNTSQVFEKAKHSLVGVSCGKWEGSGVAIEMQVPDNYETAVLSAAHVFDDCKVGDKVAVEHEGQTFTGVLAKRDPATGKVPLDGTPTNDLALIYVATKLPTLDAAPEARIGDWAMALGNPWSYLDYMSLGVISNADQDTYSTDSEINSGDSGGPLLDSQGRVLGILVSTPIRADQFEDNPKGIWDSAEGISTVIRLRMACPVLLSSQGDCPFKN